MYYLLVMTTVTLLRTIECLELPKKCSTEQYYDIGSLSCQLCPANNSMIRSDDGFSCKCVEHSIPVSHDRCKPCNSTEVVSADGSACVNRRCQNLAGKFLCRKCPADYIMVTQNFDGSPMREVSCVKCARGFKQENNKCVRCTSCSCDRGHVVVHGLCLPKQYVTARHKYEENMLHPQELLDVVKYEYLCTRNDILSCVKLTSLCVQSFYSNDRGGPCALWIHNKYNMTRGLPSLTLPITYDKKLDIINLPKNKTITIVFAVFTSDGKMVMNDESRGDHGVNECMAPVHINIGTDTVCECKMNLPEVLSSYMNETLSPYLYTNEQYIPLPVAIRKPNGELVKRGIWQSELFQRLFRVHSTLSTVSNITNFVYMKKLVIRVRLVRASKGNGSLGVEVSMEAQYAIAPAHEHVVVTSVTVEHDMPSAGIVRGIEICSGVLGALLLSYALVRWRGCVRRGGTPLSAVPLLAGTIADILYFSVLLSSAHAWAAEAGTLGMTLPLSRLEERMITTFIYTAVSLKCVKVGWIVWKQCTCDLFYLDWTKYNTSIKESHMNEDVSWKVTLLAREWSSLQTKRRVNPGYTVILTIIIVQLLSHFYPNAPRSVGYQWVVYSITWWSTYSAVFIISWIKQRITPCTSLTNICKVSGHSLLVFEEEFYAHYVHGRSEECGEGRSMAGPLTACRVAFVPQIRAVYRQLSAPVVLLEETESRHALLSKFLAAFFERALDGLNWVASERTMLERLLDVEVTTREGGNTSALLYDDDDTPSCFSMTWWYEEWNLCTLEAMLLSAVFAATQDATLACATAYIAYKVLKQLRTIFGNRNQFVKTGIDINYH